MQNIFESSTELSQEGGVTCKFSKKLSGDGDRDDINLGADGGVFIFADGKDMGSDKKYEFFPQKVDFDEFRMPSYDGGTYDEQQEKNNSGNTDTMAFDDQHQESASKDIKSLEFGLGQTDDFEPVDEQKDKNKARNTDSIALEDRYQERANKDTDMNSQEIGLGQTDDFETVDVEQDENIAGKTNGNKSQDTDVLGPVVESKIGMNDKFAHLGKVGISFQCDGNTNGYRFLHLPKTFTKFIECDKGVFYKRDCPRASLFFVTLQCCINYAKFPCRQNCAN